MGAIEAISAIEAIAATSSQPKPLNWEEAPTEEANEGANVDPDSSSSAAVEEGEKARGKLRLPCGLHERRVEVSGCLSMATSCATYHQNHCKPKYCHEPKVSLFTW